MKELLLADAHQLSASPSKYEATRQQIARAEYKTFTLSEADFYNLVKPYLNFAKLWSK